MGITWARVACLRLVRPDVHGDYRIPPYGYDHILIVYKDGSPWMIACVLSHGDDLSLAQEIASMLAARYGVPVE